MTELINSQTFFDVTIPMAKEAGAYQRSQMNTQLEVEFKGEINLVTQVDKACEDMIVSTIQSHFPNHDILAEEGTGDRKDSSYKWIIDPLDGTTNFAHGYPLYAVSIGLEYKGEIVGGIVYDPNRDEMFKAFLGEGSYLNDKKINVSKVKKLDKALLGTGFAYNIRKAKKNNLNHFKNFLLKAQAVRRDGVASTDMCYVACGRYDGFWELNLFPWDTAAGLIIAVEAGAKISRFDGSPYSVYEKDVLLTNGLFHDEMIELLRKG